MERKFDFETEAAAWAFVQGIEYVNDDSIEVVSVEQPEGHAEWCVTLIDHDAKEE